MGVIVSRFPEVPTIRLIGFPFLQERVFNAGYMLPFLGGVPSVGGGGNFGSLRPPDWPTKAIFSS